MTAMKFLNRPRAGNSPRAGRKHVTLKGINWTSSNTLYNPNSPLASRRDNQNQALNDPNSAQNSPKTRQKTRPRPRTLSDDRNINNEELGETVALLSNLKSALQTSSGITEIELDEQTSAIV